MIRRYIRIINIVLGISLVVLELVNVFLSNTLGTASIQANKLKNEIYVYEQKNVILREKLLGLTSFEMISSRAADLGFVEPKRIISLSTPQKIALNQ